MSYYLKLWSESINDLGSILEKENSQALENPAFEGEKLFDTPLKIYEYARQTYIDYLQLYQKMEKCYENYIYYQKRVEMAEIIESVLSRMAQLYLLIITYAPSPIVIQGNGKGVALSLPRSTPYISVMDLLGDRGLHPDDLELPVPRHAIERNLLYLIEREEMLDDVLKSNNVGSITLSTALLDNSTTSLGNGVRDGTSVLAPLTPHLAASVLQRCEKLRQGLLAFRKLQQERTLVAATVEKVHDSLASLSLSADSDAPSSPSAESGARSDASGAELSGSDAESLSSGEESGAELLSSARSAPKRWPRSSNSAAEADGASERQEAEHASATRIQRLVRGIQARKAAELKRHIEFQLLGMESNPVGSEALAPHLLHLLESPRDRSSIAQLLHSGTAPREFEGKEKGKDTDKEALSTLKLDGSLAEDRFPDAVEVLRRQLQNEAELQRALPQVKESLRAAEGPGIYDSLRAPRDAWLQSRWANGSLPEEFASEYYAFVAQEAQRLRDEARERENVGKGKEKGKEKPNDKDKSKEKEKQVFFRRVNGQLPSLDRLRQLLAQHQTRWAGLDQRYLAEGLPSVPFEVEFAKALLRPIVEREVQLEVDQALEERLRNEQLAQSGGKLPKKAKKAKEKKAKKEKPPKVKYPGLKACADIAANHPQSTLAALAALGVLVRVPPSLSLQSMFQEIETASAGNAIGYICPASTPASGSAPTDPLEPLVDELDVPPAHVLRASPAQRPVLRHALNHSFLLPLLVPSVSEAVTAAAAEHARAEPDDPKAKAASKGGGKLPSVVSPLNPFGSRKFEDLKSLLLVGPPGAGKQHLAFGLAASARALVLRVNFQELALKGLDEKSGAARVLHLIYLIMRDPLFSPVVLVLEDVDLIFGKAKAGAKGASKGKAGAESGFFGRPSPAAQNFAARFKKDFATYLQILQNDISRARAANATAGTSNSEEDELKLQNLQNNFGLSRDVPRVGLIGISSSPQTIQDLGPLLDVFSPSSVHYVGLPSRSVRTQAFAAAFVAVHKWFMNRAPDELPSHTDAVGGAAAILPPPLLPLALSNSSQHANAVAIPPLFQHLNLPLLASMSEGYSVAAIAAAVREACTLPRLALAARSVPAAGSSVYKTQVVEPISEAEIIHCLAMQPRAFQEDSDGAHQFFSRVVFSGAAIAGAGEPDPKAKKK